MSARAAACGSRSGPSMVANVSPGTPATANSPVTRSGLRTASSNMVFTPIDQPMQHGPVDAVVVHDRQARPRRTPRSRPASGPPGRSEPPVPRWFHETTRTPQSGDEQRRPGPAAPMPRPLQSTTVGPSSAPSGSLVHVRRRVPSSERTSSNAIRASPAVRAADVGMAPILPERTGREVAGGVAEAHRWREDSTGGPCRSLAVPTSDSAQELGRSQAPLRSAGPPVLPSRSQPALRLRVSRPRRGRRGTPRPRSAPPAAA